MHGLDLLPRHRELLHHLVDGHTVFKIPEDDQHNVVIFYETTGTSTLVVTIA